MTKIQQTVDEVKTLRRKVLEDTLSNAVSAFPHVFKMLPERKGAEWTPREMAQMRWKLLNAGFSHEEAQAVNRRMCLAVQTGAEHEETKLPVNLDTWLEFVEDACVPRLQGTMQYVDLKVIRDDLKSRFEDEKFSPHEAAVIKMGQQLQDFLENKPPAAQETIIKYFAQTIDVRPEVVWRVATGSPKITQIHLGRLVRAIAQYAADLSEGMVNLDTAEAEPKIEAPEQSTEDLRQELKKLEDDQEDE